MHYKIVGVSDASPDQPEIYHGQFTPMPTEPQLLTALVAEFGTPGEPAEGCLQDWSEGEVSYWVDDLCPGDTEHIVHVGNTTFHIYVDAQRVN
ncbi:MAG: hypothetical protein HQ582_08025 [Planctomycetes bacterium]|nr:hypothetical protein [Planctomycetota bacterium]